LIPVHIITGFLGAGKTTAILRLFDKKPTGENWAIVINEFGKISIDGQILQSKSAEGSVFEISGGCICCSAKGYFQENLEKIIALNKFDRIVIEPSGIGGISHITDLAKRHKGLLLMPVVCLTDLTMTRHPRLLKAPIFREQIENSDRIIFTKLDLLTEEEITDNLATFSLEFPAIHFELKTTDDIDLHCSDMKIPEWGNPKLPKGYPALIAGKEHWQVHSLSDPGNNPVDQQKLGELLRAEHSVVRAKGYIYTGEGWVLFNYTLSGISVDVCPPRKSGEFVVIYDITVNVNIQLFKIKLAQLISGI